MIDCNCDGIEEPHHIGCNDCFREIFTDKVISNDDNAHTVEGSTITRFTLTEQRGFHYHTNENEWCRPKIRDSVNSL